jgi:hypothetical protein
LCSLLKVFSPLIGKSVDFGARVTSKDPLAKYPMTKIEHFSEKETHFDFKIAQRPLSSNNSPQAAR